MAAQKDPRVLTFEVPVNLAGDLSYIAQMCHFLIVNTTQKSVDKAVEQKIMARLTEALDVEDIPSLPKWIRNTVERREVDHALKHGEREKIERTWMNIHVQHEGRRPILNKVDSPVSF